MIVTDGDKNLPVARSSFKLFPESTTQVYVYEKKKKKTQQKEKYSRDCRI